MVHSQNVIYSDKKSTSVPYYQRYTLDFEQELNPSTSFTVSYVGAQGRKGMNLVNINLPPYQTGWSSVMLINAARPNNSGRFSDIYVQRPNLNSFYNAGIVSFKHRFSNSWQATSSYTFAKTVSDYPWINNLAYNGAAGGGANYLAFASGFQYPNIYDRGESIAIAPAPVCIQRHLESSVWSGLVILGKNPIHRLAIVRDCNV